MKYLKLLIVLYGLFIIANSALLAQQVIRVYQTDKQIAVYTRVDSIVCTMDVQTVYAAGQVFSTLISKIDSVVYDSITPDNQVVDLGLSVKWAGWNVGAFFPEENGGYYAWGEVKEKDLYTLSTYQHYDKDKNQFTFIGNNISGTEYDVARVKWGGNWRMPTLLECKELVERCKWEWVSYNGMVGYLVTGPNGNCIFLPAVGFCAHSELYGWKGSGLYSSSTIYDNLSVYTYYLGCSIGDDVCWNYGERYHGQSVRPVLDEIKLNPAIFTKEVSSVAKNSALLQGYVEGVLTSTFDCRYGFLYGTVPDLIRFGEDIYVGSNHEINYSYLLTGLKDNTTYYYCAYLLVDGKYIYGDTLSFTTAKNEEITSGHLVDLGLSVKWAAWNIGATKPEEYGSYYAWGELKERNDYTTDTYQYFDKFTYMFIGYDISGTKYDVARVKWGENWRIPTIAEIGELYRLCKWEWMTYNGIRGQKITGPNGNSIFIPAAGIKIGTDIYGLGMYGCYWSSSLYVSDYGRANGLGFPEIIDEPWFNNAREYGRPIRPVSD